MVQKRVCIGFLAGLLLFVFAAWFRNDCLLGIDDADIFFSYAENFASGHGITYGNNGVPVEGMTSFLWFLVCSLSFVLRLNETGVFVCSVILLFLTQLAWLRIIGTIGNRRSTCLHIVIYGLLILGSPGYVPWMTVTLMDTVLWGSIVAWLSISLLYGIASKNRSPRKSIFHCVPFLLAPWARPESMLIVPGLLAIIVFVRILQKDKIGGVWLWAGSFVFSLVAVTVFRMCYFGFPFPNTFYAKVSPSFLVNLKGGAGYAFQFIRSGAIIAVFVLFGFAELFQAIRSLPLRWRGFSKMANPVFCLWIWCILLLLPPILTGGDHFGSFRFFQPVYPLMVILTILSIDKWFPHERVSRSRTLVFVAWLVLLFSAFWGWKEGWTQWKPSPIIRHFVHAQIGRDQGYCLSEIFHEETNKPVVGVIAAGGVARTYSGKIVDVLGLNDPMIAHYPGRREGIKNHAAFEPDAFAKTDIDILLAGPYKQFSTILKDVFDTSSFASDWRFVTIWSREKPEVQLSALVSKRFLDKIENGKSIGIWDAMIWNGKKWSRNWEKCPVSTTGTDPTCISDGTNKKNGVPCWRLPPGHVLWW